MAEDFFSRDYPIIGCWSRLLLHPDWTPAHAYSELKRTFASKGATLIEEIRGADRTPSETLEVPAEDRALSFWKIGSEAIILREDGIFAVTDLPEPVAHALIETLKVLQDPTTVEKHTFSLAPMLPDVNVREMFDASVAKILKPLDKGPFENGRFWTTVDHIHEVPDTRKRYYEKVGITIEVPDKKSKKAAG